MMPSHTPERYDEIERLRARVAELEGALKSIERKLEDSPATHTHLFLEVGRYCADTARAALAKDKAMTSVELEKWLRADDLDEWLDVYGVGLCREAADALSQCRAEVERLRNDELLTVANAAQNTILRERIAELEAENKDYDEANRMLMDCKKKLRARVAELEAENAALTETNETLLASAQLAQGYIDNRDLYARVEDAEDRAVHWHKQHGILRARIAELEGALLRCEEINDNPACFNRDLDDHLRPFIGEIKRRSHSPQHDSN